MTLIMTSPAALSWVNGVLRFFAKYPQLGIAHQVAAD
jgi:hypothetical protein